jgi:hypothetical protein
VNTFQPSIPGYSFSSDSRFTGSLGLGVKTYVNPNFGFRFEGKVRSTYINSEDDHWPATAGGATATTTATSQWYTAGEATAGVVIAF